MKAFVIVAIVVAGSMLVAVLCANRAASIADHKVAQMREKEGTKNGDKDY